MIGLNNFILKTCMVISIISMLLAANLVSAQTKKEQKNALRDRDKYVFAVQIKQKDFLESVSYENKDGLIIVPVKINGKTYHFLFDTGATSVISLELQKTLSLKPTIKSSLQDASGESQGANFYMLDRLQIGSISFKNIGVAAMDLNAFSQALCSNIDGIIGANLMRTAYWKIDYNSNTLSFSDKTIEPGKDAIALNFMENFSGNPVVSLSLGSSKFDGIWDSGNNKYIDLPDSTYFKLGKTENRQYVKGKGSISQSISQMKEINVYESLIDTININDQLFTKEMASIKPKEMGETLIGNAFMERYGEIILDWKDKKIYLNSLPKARDSSLTRTFGFTPNCSSGTCTIVFLWENSLADQQGVQLGDTIVFINGKDMIDISAEEWCLIRSEVKNTDKVELKISKEGEAKDFIFSKYDLFGKE